jgi:hypothetical protein
MEYANSPNYVSEKLKVVSKTNPVLLEIIGLYALKTENPNQTAYDALKALDILATNLPNKRIPVLKLELVALAAGARKREKLNVETMVRASEEFIEGLKPGLFYELRTYVDSKPNPNSLLNILREVSVHLEDHMIDQDLREKGLHPDKIVNPQRVYKN